MVVLTDTLDWGAMEARVQQIRARKRPGGRRICGPPSARWC
jgi:hypothetical protein